MNPIQHATQFMLDYKHSVTNDPVCLGDFMKKENNYDVAFCEAWEILAKTQDDVLQTATGLLNLLDKIQQCSVNHLNVKMQGRSTSNAFGITKGYLSDEEGVKDLITKIWVGNEPFTLQVLVADSFSEAYFLKNGSFKYQNSLGRGTLIKATFNDREKTLPLIFKAVLPCYRKGPCLGKERLTLINHSAPEHRQAAALKIFSVFLTKIKEVGLSDDDKREAIATTMRDLLQQHIYKDGNGRSLYILSNFLLQKNDLGMFYPENLCVFDANSKARMISEMRIGQIRFTQMFENEKTLTEKLKKYKVSVLELQKMIPSQQIKADNLQKLQSAFEERNFNLLLRLSATIKNDTNLLSYLLEHAEELNVDINAAGKTSGTALEVAKKHENLPAITLLQEKL